ncbi:MAG: hypothetical protein ACREDJ_03200, partial [Methylocella sp.]
MDAIVVGMLARQKSLIAAARKLVVLLNAILRDKRPWHFSSKQGLAHAGASIRRRAKVCVLRRC